MKMPRMIKDKKAQVDEGEESGYRMSFSWITNLIMVGGIFIVFIFIVFGNAQAMSSAAKGLETYSLIFRFIYSPDCFSHYDYTSGRIYSGVFELEKFTQENLDYCYNTHNQYVPAFNITVEGKSYSTMNWMEGARPEAVREYPIILTENNKRSIGEMKVEIQNFR